MPNIHQYSADLVKSNGKTFLSGEIFAKVLTTNDDSGRHGVLIPSDAYSFFPQFNIVNPGENQTLEFGAFEAGSAISEIFAYKYYKRYPERRITRLPSLLNDMAATRRLLVCLRAKHSDGSSEYYFDCANSASGGRFAYLFNLIFGREIPTEPGIFIVRPVGAATFVADATLEELLGKFDEVKERGWIETLRTGDTGIGYTFETLLGIKENNDQTADFKGIELKCKGVKEGEGLGAGKINLFQAGPSWRDKMPMKDRIRILGSPGVDGLYSCYSQLTTNPNNLGLLLSILEADKQVGLQKNDERLGHWSFDSLAKRLEQKHSRAAFIKARRRITSGRVQYLYEQLVYCEKPSIERFNRMLSEHSVVFEFIMSEKTPGRVRNHGYPWRLVREEFLDQLFAFQIKLR